MSVKPKEIIGIVGESGSGKSTLIRAVLGLLPIGGRVSVGEIIFKGRNLFEYSKKEWRELRGNRIGISNIRNPILASFATEYCLIGVLAVGLEEHLTPIRQSN